MSIEIRFKSSVLSEVNHSIEAFANYRNELFVQIRDDSQQDEFFQSHFVALDLPTAIKFVKHLKFHISQMKQNEQA